MFDVDKELAMRSSQIKGKDSGTLAEANRKFDEGLDAYQQGIPYSNPKWISNLQRAAERFQDAACLYESARKKDPNNRQIEDRISEALRLRYHALKMQPLRR
jgi:hypothetical protein